MSTTPSAGGAGGTSKRKLIAPWSRGASAAVSAMTPEQRSAAVKASSWARARHIIVPVWGCRWCGHPHAGHVQRYVEGHGWHTWTTPTQEQYEARLTVWLQAQQEVRGDVAE